MPKQSSTPKVITKKHMARLERERRQVNLIRGIAIGGILIVLGLLGYGYLNLNVFQLNQPVAEVNGVRVSTREWQERVRFQRAQMLNVYNQYAFYQQSFGFDYSQQLSEIQSMLQAPEIIGQQALDQMRDDILIRQEAERRGITVSEAEIETSFQENFGFFPEGSPTPTITPTEFSYPTLTSQQLTLFPSTATPTEATTSTPESAATRDPSATSTPTATVPPPSPTPVPELPTATATPYTVEGFQADYKTMVENYKSFDISEQTLRSIYEANLLRQKLADELGKDLPRSEEQVLARHILVDTEEEAQEIYQLLQEGADFAELARTRSKDTGSGANGGDLGWFGPGAMVPEFEQAAFGLEVGEISEPVQSEFGYHIIQLIARQELPVTDSQYEQKKQQILEDWLTAARESADITTYEVWKERVPAEPSLQQQTPAQ
jgi:parvulin-like peptidyl-prolyl isomerase